MNCLHGKSIQPGSLTTSCAKCNEVLVANNKLLDRHFRDPRVNPRLRAFLVMLMDLAQRKELLLPGKKGKHIQVLEIEDLSQCVTTDTQRAFFKILEGFTSPRVVGMALDCRSCRVFNPLSRNQYWGNGHPAESTPAPAEEPSVDQPTGQVDQMMTCWFLGERDIPVGQIVAYQQGQTRQAANEGFGKESLRRLGESLQREGQLESIVVRQLADGRFELVAGERRTRAARLVGMSTLRAKILKSETPDDVIFTVMLVENIDKAELTSVEKALACVRAEREYGWTRRQIAGKTGLTEARISQLQDLARLIPEARDYIIANPEWFSVQATLDIAVLPKSDQLRVAQEWLEQRKVARWKKKPAAAVAAAKPPTQPARAAAKKKPKRPLDLVHGGKKIYKDGRYSSVKAVQREGEMAALRALVAKLVPALKAVKQADLGNLMTTNYSGFEVLRSGLDSLAKVAAELARQMHQMD